MMHVKRWMTATILILSLSACGTIPTAPKLPIPQQPEYPKIQAEQLRCLDKETMKSLVERDQLKTDHIIELENIIRTTH